MQCRRCQQDNPPHAKFCLECATPLKSSNESGRPGSSYALLQLALSEALERENASSEILRVISNSPNDLASVFDTILDNVLRLCEAQLGSLFLYDGDTFAIAAQRGTPPAAEDAFPRFRAGPTTGLGRMLAERRPVHIPDIRAEEAYRQGDPLRVATADLLGARTFLAVPLLKDSAVLGAGVIYRREVRPFDETHIALLQTFADQAVIAIENVRLFNELEGRNRDLTEALEQQTATAEILRVISQSPTDVQPVFDAIVRSAAHLCNGLNSAAFLYDGEFIHNVALSDASPDASEEIARHFPQRPNPEFAVGRVVLTGGIVHSADVVSDPTFGEGARRTLRFRGVQALLAAPMLRDGRVIGSISVGRAEPGLFTGSQVQLLQTFADQAVIAIENVRLFTELKRRNRDLTATSEILRVISQSPTDVQPVFDTIVRRAVTLCDGLFGSVLQFDGELLHFVAQHNHPPEGLATMRRAYPVRPSRSRGSGRAIVERAVVHIPDVELDPEYPDKAVSRAIGYRSGLFVPMLRDGAPIGVIAVARAEPGLFSDSEIELLKTFADQAVIAIENVRLFKELEARNRDLTESLEQQTATGEILRVISSSPTDAQPVFDTIVRSSDRLLGGLAGSLALRVGDEVHLVALTPTNPGGDAVLRRLYPMPIGEDGGHAEVVRLCRPLMITDTEAELTGRTREFARIRGFRSRLSVPLIRDGIAIGSLGVTRAAPGAFTDREIALLQTFADQAVIAIENVRLFTELQASNRELTTALDTQTATSDILRVISRSQTDVQPVFDAIVVSAVRLLGAYTGALTRLADGQIELAALTSVDDAGDAAVRATFPHSIQSEGPYAQVMLDRAPLNVADAQTDPRWPDAARARARVRGYRSWAAVPLLRHDEGVGAISVARREPGGFAADEIALLKTFADQAVIAIENARLFKELQEKNRALTEAHGQVTEALEQQTATSEILRVISTSPTDLQPVFETIAENAVRLCDATVSGVLRFDGALIHLAAYRNFSPEVRALVPQDYPMEPTRRRMSGRAILDRTVVHAPDVLSDPDYPQEVARSTGWRSFLSVPMLREGQAIGAVTVVRTQPGPFSDRQITLLQTFADQAVIAIENVRLFTELQASNRELTTALDKQTATSDILRVISRSQTNVQPVFDAILASAVRLLGAYSGALTRIEGDQIALAAMTSTDEVGDAVMMAFFPQSCESGGPHGQVIRDRAPLNIADAQTDSRLHEAAHVNARARGYRSQAVVPLLRQDEAVGTIAVTRREPGGFTEAEIALLQTFADQAVIAIENVRLFRELDTRNRDLTEALEQQTATAEILKVISQSPTDVQPVFDTIVQSAVRLCDAVQSNVQLFDGELMHWGAQLGIGPETMESIRRVYPMRPDQSQTASRAVLTGSVVHLPDVLDDPEYRHELALKGGWRGVLSVPMIRQGDPIGAITVARLDPGPFSETQIALLQTFADQAVIAVENVRLFTELQARTQELSRSVSELQALGEVGQAISSTLDLETVLTTIVSRAVQLSALDGGVVFEYDEGTEEFVHRAATETGATLAEARRATRVQRGEGVVGQTALTLEPAQVPDITVPGAYDSRLRGNLIESGVRAILAVPMVREGQLIGCLVVSRNRPGDFPADTIELLRTFATQSALAIQNARLFEEIADKSRQLEAASRHKSEFLANMSHELRTPLNAVIGFSEVLIQRMFGDLNPKQDEYLKDIYASGQHLLSLINDILDLSKIEAGRMELAPVPFHLPSALDNAVTLVKERAARHGITLQVDVDPELGEIVGDERKVKQVLLNLLSNAVKFTPEGGRITLKAGQRDGAVEIAVSDTGIGIAEEDQASIFEEFRQVGSDETRKQEGTGLGLTLAKKFVELHGGRIWVASEPDRGSTFTFTLPVH